MKEISHALGLHMHQPPENLRLLLEHDMWEARQIIMCYARPERFVRNFADVAHLNIGFSGVLLEQLTDPDIQREVREMCDMEEVLQQYRSTEQIEVIGMGYYHPVFPLIPKEDWNAHLERGRMMIKETFGVQPIGFWPSELAFSMEMIPSLRQTGYEYVVVDGVHVHPEEGDKGKETWDASKVYTPHLARHEGYEIVVVPRDRDVSNAQESGMDPVWFENEVTHKTASAEGSVLVTTWSDGENGGWFRQMDEDHGFWGHFFAPCMKRVREGAFPLQPVRLSDYINDNPPRDYVVVQTGAWNVARTSGFDFSQWSQSPGQQKALEEIREVSRIFHRMERAVGDSRDEVNDPEHVEGLLNQAHEWLLRAETSCYLFWGDAWVSKVYDQTKPARIMLKQIADILA
ncbi:MAG: glycoside hydrolase family 57 [bacterium]